MFDEPNNQPIMNIQAYHMLNTNLKAFANRNGDHNKLNLLNSLSDEKHSLCLKSQESSMFEQYRSSRVFN